MIVLLYTDILIDIALDRKPFSDHAVIVIDFCQKNILSGFVAWHSISNFHYLVSPAVGKNDSKRFIDELLDFIGIPLTSTRDLKFALQLDLADYEDAMQVSAAVSCHAEIIVTRNTKDYVKSPIPANKPEFILQNF